MLACQRVNQLFLWSSTSIWLFNFAYRPWVGCILGDATRSAAIFLRATVTHRIHGAGIYANLGGILMVNVTIYSIHGSYGLSNFILRK